MDVADLSQDLESPGEVGIGLVAAAAGGRDTTEPLVDPPLESTGPILHAVERSFEIVGEALSQLRKIDDLLATSISDYRKIIGFWNVLIHGYGQVDDELTWAIVETDLPVLLRELESFLNAPSP